MNSRHSAGDVPRGFGNMPGPGCIPPHEHVTCKGATESNRRYVVELSAGMEDKKLTFNPARSKKLHNPSDKGTVREALSLEIVIQILQDICGLKEDERRLMAANGDAARRGAWTPLGGHRL